VLVFEEHRTSEFVVAKLAEFGCEVLHNIRMTGVVGVLEPDLRADMDDLPIREASSSCTTTGVICASSIHAKGGIRQIDPYRKCQLAASLGRHRAAKDRRSLETW
jgi:hypothetical protein